MFPWFWLWAPQVQFPFSGSVAQRIDPDTRWFFGGIRPQAGDGELEQRIHEDIASYGRQLGLLTEALLGLAGSEQVGPEQAGRSMKRLEDIRTDVEALKREADSRLAAQASAALDRLARHDPGAAAALAERYRAPRLSKKDAP
jgi:hypothetical protein